MEKKYIISFDGFLQRERRYTFSEIVEIWKDSVKNKWLYQYDCSVYEMNDDDTVNRRVEYHELDGLDK